MTDTVDTVEIFTDGACSGNPGPGGWGAVLRFGDEERLLSGSEPDTTNNRMELLAAIRALETLKRRCRVVLTTDSQYVMKGVTEWMPVWKQNGWRTASKKPVRNQDLWTELDVLLSQHEISWEWVRGHTGHPENEQADCLARQAISDLEQA